MGLLKGLFNRSRDDGGEGGDTSATLTCVACGDKVPADEIEDDECEECRAADYSGDTYCCGMIYEDGEDTCISCGEPL